MESIQIKIAKALDLEKQGNIEESLDAFNNIFNLLIEEASNYALKKIGVVESREELKKYSSLLIEYSNEYLRQGLLAATVLNEMGVLFETLGDIDNAKQKFGEATNYIPQGINYSDPQNNINRLLQTENMAIEFEDED